MTIATNMAGRGTDILLGGNPEVLAVENLHKRGTNILEATPEQYAEALAEAEQLCAEDKEKVLAAGGMHILGTERHEARRIDNQLRGRAGRQGDPGSSRFYLSLEDDLMRRFANDRVQGIMKTLGFNDDTALESKMVSRTIESAQTRVEGYNFDTRKHVVEYDDVINRQRETIYRERDRILRSSNLGPTIEAMLDEEVGSLVADHTGTEYATEWNRDGLKAQLTTMVPSLTDADLRDDRRGARWRRAGRDAHRSRARTVRGQARRGRRGGHRRPRAPGPAAGDRLALGRAPDGGRRHAPRHRPAGVLAARPAQRVQDRGVPDVRRAEGDDPARRDPHDLPGDRPDPATQQRPVARNVVEGRASIGDSGSAGGAATATVVAGNGNGAPVARSGPKVGRNDPCWCGSGKKFKKCHGA